MKRAENARAAPENYRSRPAQMQMEYDELAVVAILVILVIAVLIVLVVAILIVLVVLVILVIAVLIVVRHDGASFRMFCLQALLCAAE